VRPASLPGDRFCFVKSEARELPVLEKRLAELLRDRLSSISNPCLQTALAFPTAPACAERRDIQIQIRTWFHIVECISSLLSSQVTDEKNLCGYSYLICPEQFH